MAGAACLARKWKRTGRQGLLRSDQIVLFSHFAKSSVSPRSSQNGDLYYTYKKPALNIWISKLGKRNFKLILYHLYFSSLNEYKTKALQSCSNWCFTIREQSWAGLRSRYEHLSYLCGRYSERCYVRKTQQISFKDVTGVSKPGVTNLFAPESFLMGTELSEGQPVWNNHISWNNTISQLAFSHILVLMTLINVKTTLTFTSSQ